MYNYHWNDTFSKINQASLEAYFPIQIYVDIDPQNLTKNMLGVSLQYCFFIRINLSIVK